MEEAATAVLNFCVFMQNLIEQSLGDMSRKSSSVPPLALETCEYLNISICPATSGIINDEVNNCE